MKYHVEAELGERKKNILYFSFRIKLNWVLRYLVMLISPFLCQLICLLF